MSEQLNQSSEQPTEWDTTVSLLRLRLDILSQQVDSLHLGPEMLNHLDLALQHMQSEVRIAQAKYLAKPKRKRTSKSTGS